MGIGKNTSAALPEAPALDKALGLVLDEVGVELVRGHLVITPITLQPFGIVHGGVYAVMGETIASYGAHLRIAGSGETTVGTANSTSFLRTVSEGTLTAVGRVRHAGRTTQVWDVEMTNDDGKLCAVSRVTLAIR